MYVIAYLLWTLVTLRGQTSLNHIYMIYILKKPITLLSYLHSTIIVPGWCYLHLGTLFRVSQLNPIPFSFLARFLI